MADDPFEVGADAVLAGRIDAELRREPLLAPKPLNYSVEGGKVTLYVDDADAARAAQRLRGVEGLGSLTTRALP